MVLKYNLFTETSEIAYNYVKRHSWIYDYALYPYRNLWAKKRILLIQSSRIGLLKKRWITLIFLSLDPRWIPKATHCDLVKGVFRRFWPVMCVYSDFWLVPCDSILCSHWSSGALLFACFTTVEKYSYPDNLFLQTRGENAPWSLAIKHFTDIRESKGQWL